jgi:hypothetical protein
MTENGSSPQAELVAAVHEWHDAAGRPSLRAVSVPAGVSHTTVSDLLNGSRIPSWPYFSRIAATLGADAGTARELWLRATPQKIALRGSRAAVDPEIRAVQVASGALAPLTQDARRRVLTYLFDRFTGEEPR